MECALLLLLLPAWAFVAARSILSLRHPASSQLRLGQGAEPSHSPTASACEVHRDFIELSLSKGRNAKAIYQDLVDDHGLRASYQSVKRFVGKLRGSTAAEACSVIVTPPGEELQVDHGTGPVVRDPHTGRYRRSHMFALTLGYSRKAVHLLTFTSSTQTWVIPESLGRRSGEEIEFPQRLEDSVLELGLTIIASSGMDFDDVSLPDQTYAAMRALQLAIKDRLGHISLAAYRASSYRGPEGRSPRTAINNQQSAEP